MKKYVLCVHGIGKHTNDWIATPDDGISFKDNLSKIWDIYAKSNSRNTFDNEVELIPIHYDDEIVKIFTEWVKNADKVKAELQTAPTILDQVDWFVDALDKASAANADDDFRFTHLMDLILFAGIQSIQDRLVVYVGKQIADHINKIRAGGKPAEISLIAHSMGTAMMHKVIQDLFTESAQTAFGTQTLRGDFKFKNITMVANCGFALSRERKSFYSGVVRPSITAGEGCCTTWINVGHRLDPVARFMPFDPHSEPKWLDPFIAAKGWYSNITLNSISSRNIHSLNHYFRDPELHIRFLNLAFDFDYIDDQKLKDAINTFQQSTFQGQLKSLKVKLEQLDVTNKTSFKDFIVSLEAFIKIIKGF